MEGWKPFFIYNGLQPKGSQRELRCEHTPDADIRWKIRLSSLTQFWETQPGAADGQCCDDALLLRDRQTDRGAIGCWGVHLTRTQVDISHPCFSQTFCYDGKTRGKNCKPELCVAFRLYLSLSSFFLYFKFAECRNEWLSRSDCCNL